MRPATSAKAGQDKSCLRQVFQKNRNLDHCKRISNPFWLRHALCIRLGDETSRGVDPLHKDSAPADRISFLLNGRQVTVAPEVSPASNLLDWLRGPAGLSGTKEGCAEGDCGACTVVLEQPGGERTPINACLMLLGQMHGRAVRTVEGLRAADGGAHPVAEALAAANATQCGFCTPGIVMSAWAHVRQGGDVHEALAGNLCRCTGYRPIVDAFAAMTDDGACPPELPEGTAAYFASEGCQFHLPTSMAALLALRVAHPKALLLAGGTDLGLLVSEGRKLLPEIICLLDVPELQRMVPRDDGIQIGAAVPYERLLRYLDAHPDDTMAPLAALLSRLGSRQIRGMGTLGGNLGTASPIGDALPPLLALGATVTLRGPSGARTMPVEDFLIGYRQNALAADEIIESVFLPRPPVGALFVCEKISKRHDQDIATVGAALLVELVDGKVSRVRLAFGGMGPKAARATAAEAVLQGAAWSEANVERAAVALAQDFAPLTDLRGTDLYRRIVAANLLRRFWWRHARPDLALEPHAVLTEGV